MTKVVGLLLKNKRDSTHPEREVKSAPMAKKRQESPKALALTSKGYERHRVKHDYHDYAQALELPSQLEMDMAVKASGGVNNPFPTILHKLLTETDMMGFSHLISWQSHGRSFLIHKPRDFVRDVVPRYFKHSKLSSFQRQLSLYGFVRLTNEGPDKGAYYHELFLKGRPFLCSKIQRTRVKGTWVRTSSSPESEPDFFAMEPVADLENPIFASAYSTSYTTNSVSSSGSGNQNSESLNSPNFVTPKSSPSLRGEGKRGRHTLSMEEFNLETSLLQNESAGQDLHEYVSGPQVTSCGIHPPPSLPKLLLDKSGTCSLGDQIIQESCHTLSHQSLPTTTSSRIESTNKVENDRLDVAGRSLQHPWNQKWYSSEITSLARLGKVITNPDGVDEDEDELRNFLRDVDLEFELEMVEEILQSSVF